MLELEVCRAGNREGKMDVNVGDRGHIGAHKHKLDPPCRWPGTHVTHHLQLR